MEHINITTISNSIIEFTELVDYGDEVFRPYVDAYLIIGDHKALLIDCLQNTDKLYQLVRRYTDLPIDVLITHGHGDHAGASLLSFAENGCKIYIVESDIEPLTYYNNALNKELFTPLSDGMVFDIGGYILETITCPGHTKGSVVFLDRKHGIMFSGDSIGSGILWMQIPGCLSILEYKSSLDKLLQKTATLKELNIYPGHRNQSPVQLTLRYISDTAHIVDGLIDGTIEGEERAFPYHDGIMNFSSAAYGQMLEFCYNPDRIK